MNQRGTFFPIRIGIGAVVVGLCCGCGAWCWCWRCAGVPDRYPLGSVNRAHYETMQTNAQAADFILYRNEFVGNTTELTPYGKDHVLEIAARAANAPFPILVERSEHNSDPPLDERRRSAIVEVLSKCGVADGNQRTIVAPAYGKGLSAQEAEADYNRFINSRATGAAP